MLLFRCIKCLGFANGFRYWKMSRFYTKHPELMPQLITNLKWHGYQAEKSNDKNAVAYYGFAEDCQRSYDQYLLDNK